MKRFIALVIVVLGVGAMLMPTLRRDLSTAPAASNPDAWEYAELRVSWSSVEAKRFVSISCPEANVSVAGEMKGDDDGRKMLSEAIAKMPGTGNTVQDKMGSQGWELVNAAKDYGSPVSNAYGSQNNTTYYFKRKR